MYPSSAEAALMLYLLTVTGSGYAPTQTQAQVAQAPSPDPQVVVAQMTTTKAQSYIEKSASGDSFEIQASELALKRAKSPEVRNFAQRIIDDHRAAMQTLMSAVQSANLQMPTSLAPDKSQQATLAQLKNARDSEFDRLYLQTQIAAHREALQLHRTYSLDGDSPPLQAAANNMTTIIEEHLSDAEEIYRGLTTSAGQLMEAPTNPLGSGAGQSNTLGPNR